MCIGCFVEKECRGFSGYFKKIIHVKDMDYFICWNYFSNYCLQPLEGVNF